MSPRGAGYADVPLEDCVVAENVRSEPGDVTDLTESIRRHGILQPLVGCPAPDGRHVEIFLGQRRLAAARQAGLAKVPVRLRLRPDDRVRVLEQLEENVRREAMSHVDEALAYRRLVDAGMTQVEVARAARVTGGWVSALLYLLKLPEPVRHAVHEGRCSSGTVLEVPRSIWADRGAVSRLLERPVDTASVRRWMAGEALRRAGGPAELGQKWSVRRVDLPVDVYRTAERLRRRSRGDSETVASCLARLVRDEDRRQARAAC